MMKINGLLKERMYPYIRVLPLAEQELWPPTNRDDVVKRRIREVENYLNRIPVFRFKLSNIPLNIKLKIEYMKEINQTNVEKLAKELTHPAFKQLRNLINKDKEDIRRASLVFDYVLGRHKSVSVNLRELIPLPNPLGVKIAFTVPKKVDSEFEKIFGVELSGENKYEIAGLVDVPDWPVYFVKPDFLTYDMREYGQKSPRFIPFKAGFVRVVLEVEYGNGKKDRLKLGEAEVYWIRHTKPCDAIAYIMRKKGADRKSIEEKWRKCKNALSKISNWRDYFALLLVHSRVRKPSGKWEEKWFYIFRNFATTAKYPRNKVKFGNQSFEIVKFNKYKVLIDKTLAEDDNIFEVEPYNHVILGWYRKVKSKEKGIGYIDVSRFNVYKLKPLVEDEDWFLIVGTNKTSRLEVINKHHWGEGWGRIFIELREGEALLFRHRKLSYPKLKVFETFEIASTKVESCKAKVYVVVKEEERENGKVVPIPVMKRIEYLGTVKRERKIWSDGVLTHQSNRKVFKV